MNSDVSMPPKINKRPDASERALALLKALADEDRLRIIGLLALRPRDPLDLSMLLGITEASLGRHIRILRRAGLVVTDGDRLRIETGPIHAVMAQAAERRPASAMVPAGPSQEQRRVLGTFFEGRRLVAISGATKEISDPSCSGWPRSSRSVATTRSARSIRSCATITRTSPR